MEKLKNNGMLDVIDNVLYVGRFDREFIRVKYSNEIRDYSTSLAYIDDGRFYNCTTNKIVKKAFDKNGKEMTVPKYSYTPEKLSDNSIIYCLMDITTEAGDEYLIGMYDKAISNSNMVLIMVVLKKENANFDIYDSIQVKKFWDNYADFEIEDVNEEYQGDYEKVNINGKIYYHRITNRSWDGEYHEDTYYTTTSNNTFKVVSYNDYVKYIDEINANATARLSRYYKNKKSNYIILSHATGGSWCNMTLIDCIEDNNKIIIYGDENIDGVMGSGSGYLIAIPTNMPVGTEVEYRNCYTTCEISNLQNYGMINTDTTAYKPVIYLYPTEETEVTVEVGRPENLLHTYPKYDDGWKVIAKPNGDLIDVKTGRNLYCLYWEGLNTVKSNMQEGFIVKGEDTIVFLEEKLAILGLNEREANEFIIYWLPKLENNKYNYIRFQTIEEINENMPLEINLKPDTIIRVLMEYKGLDNPIEMKEQELTTPERNGFTVVEWGGTELN